METLPVAPATIQSAERLRSLSWEEALALPLGRSEAELAVVLETQVSRLIGHPPRATKFQREVRRLWPVSEDTSPPAGGVYKGGRAR
jgi:hypothetical protein